MRAAIALAVTPALWPTAVRQVFVLAAPGWWRRGAVPLPLPDPGLPPLSPADRVRRPVRAPEPADVITYLHWCRAWPKLARQL